MPPEVLIARSIAVGLVAAVIVGAFIAGFCKLVAPSYDAGGLVLGAGLVAMVVVTAIVVRRGDARRVAD